MKYSDFYNTVGEKSYRKYKFSNEHGEQFIVIKTKSVPEIWFVTGDETDWEMQRLFHPSFDIYSPKELLEISKAIKELSQ